MDFFSSIRDDTYMTFTLRGLRGWWVVSERSACPIFYFIKKNGFAP